MLPTIDPQTDQPIPSTMVGKLSTWSNRALHYPIFSQTWFSFRVRGFFVPMCIFTLFELLLVLIVPKELYFSNTFLWVFFLWLAIVIALLLGRWLAVKVRTKSRHELWSTKKEAIGISFAIAVGITCASLFMLTSNHFGKRMGPEIVEIKAGSQQSTKENIPKVSTPKSQDVFGNIETTTHEENSHIGITSSSLNTTSTTILNLSLWALLMIWLAGVLDLRSYFKQRDALEQAIVQEKLERYKRERNQAEMRLSVLASQVEPHFLFNTLSGVRSAMLSDPERGVLIIDHLVNYLRSTIPQMRNDGTSTESTLRMQLESIRSYLGVIHVRIPRLSFTVESPDELLDLTVPPLMLISLVENAVKHGIEPKKGPVHIAISAYKVQLPDGERLAISVKDNGVGFGGSAGATSGTGIGLSNVRERLKQLYEDQASLSLLAVEPGGVEAIIQLPIVQPEQISVIE